MAPRSSTVRALVVVLGFGLVWAKALGFTAYVDPTNIDWMIDGDWMAHLFGWLFTRNGPWALPLAQAPDLVWPHGSSAALTDAIPLLSVGGKLVSPFFGDRLQLFGVWMVSCVVGTGVVGVLVCRAWLRDTASLALAGCLFVMNPVVSARYGHPSLMAYWILAALVGACLWPVSGRTSARRTAAVTVTLGFLSCAIHSYLAVMACLLVGASLVRLALLVRPFRWPEAVGWLFAGPAAAVFSLWLFGFIAGARAAPTGSLAVEGFGQFSADLATFVNPLSWSRFFGPLPMGGRQYEGFAYLGLGVLALLVLGVVLLFWARPSRGAVVQAIPLVVACLLMAVYATSNHVTLLGKPVADWSAFYARLGPWPSIFRSSGRFVWPLYALLTMLAVLAVTRFKTLWVRQFILGGAALLQLADFNAAGAPTHKQVPAFVPFADPAWQLMKDGYKHVVVHPVQLQWICPFEGKMIAQLSWEVYRQHLTINSGHVGRPPPGTDCGRHLDPSEIDAETVYVQGIREFAADLNVPQLFCAPLDGRRVCVRADRDTPLLRALRAR